MMELRRKYSNGQEIRNGPFSFGILNQKFTKNDESEQNRKTKK